MVGAGADHGFVFDVAGHAVGEVTGAAPDLAVDALVADGVARSVMTPGCCDSASADTEEAAMFRVGHAVGVCGAEYGAPNGVLWLADDAVLFEGSTPSSQGPLGTSMGVETASLAPVAAASLVLRRHHWSRRLCYRRRLSRHLQDRRWHRHWVLCRRLRDLQRRLLYRTLKHERAPKETGHQDVRYRRLSRTTPAIR